LLATSVVHWATSSRTSWARDLLAETQSVLDTLIPCEREVRTTAGAWYLVRIQPYRTLDNVIEGAVLVFTEVTDFKLISEAVRRSETQLATAQEIAHLGSWDLDVATGRVRWSTELFKLYDRPPVSAPMSLQDALDSIVPEDRQGIAAAVQKALDTQTPYDVHYRVRHRDGAIRRMHSRAVTITDAAGRVTSLVGATLDITERRDDLNPP
jgi:PAS domain-containing protein